MELTDTDRHIIEKLQEDSRQSNAKMARELQVSEETVRRHIKAMAEAEVIHFGVTVLASHLGYTIFAILTVKVITGGSVADVVDAIIDPLDGIDIVSVNVTLEKRLIIRVAARDLETLQDEIEHVRSGGYVEDVSVEVLQVNSGWRI